jgi:hypothetical protein
VKNSLSGSSPATERSSGTEQATCVGMFESDDELETFRRDVAELVTILNNDSASLRAKGFDVDGAIAELEGKLADLEKARAEEEEALDNYLHICADVADTRTTCFRVLCAVMDPFSQENPFHPLSQEWHEWRPILVQQVPKTD